MSDVNALAKRTMWGYLLHLSYNMWSDREVEGKGKEYIAYRPYLRLDEALWQDVVAMLAKAGANTVLIDLGDGVRYRSHPEIAVQGAWSPERLRQELAAIRALGLEPLPKLNFSTAHDAWMGPYARRVSTPEYYAVCRDLIAETIELFDRPRLFHLGMDEETELHQRQYNYAQMRQHELWWEDLTFLVKEVERGGSRAWVWSDYEWHHPEEFLSRMPRTVLQSNWYYGAEFGPQVNMAKAYLDLESRSFDQIPTGSTWTVADNLERTVRFCKDSIAPARLLGFLQTVWRPTLEACRPRHIEAIEALVRAKAAYEA